MSTDVLTLAPLPWQISQWQYLVERSEKNRLPQALLLHGVVGCGKGQLARLLALSLLCEQTQQQLPCGKCSACQMFAAGSHPDFFLASPTYGIYDGDDEDDGKSKKKSTKKVVPSKQIKIDCIRDLIHFSNHAAHQGGRRVAIIEPAEGMNHNAANALLKTLEEPNDGLLIILVSHQPARLLPTLRSRCQALFCTAPEPTQALSWLQQFVSAERAKTALAITQQAPLMALIAIAEDHDVLYQNVSALLDSCQQKPSSYLSVAESLAKHDAVMIMEWWMALLRKKITSHPLASYFRFYDALQDARRKAMSTANPNTRMLFEALLIDWIALSD